MLVRDAGMCVRVSMRESPISMGDSPIPVSVDGPTFFLKKKQSPPRLQRRYGIGERFATFL